MAHSKRNTSLPHFTSYERSLLRSHWGSQQTRLNRESFLPFGACRLCLQPARTPVVACARNGDLFCRECAINDLLAQRKEIQRLERERELVKARREEDEARGLEELRKKEVRDFELVSMGLEASGKKKRKVGEAEQEKEEEGQGREVEVNGKRRKVFELGEAELSQLAKTEQERLRKEIEREKAEAKSSLPSFWIPSLTPASETDVLTKPIKLTPICPGSTEANRHEYSLKTLVDVHFTEEKNDRSSSGNATTGTEDVSRVCPSCKKVLTNGLKAILTKPCGHVICSPCVTKFMLPGTETAKPNPHEPDDPANEEFCGSKIICYVCETDITPPSSSSSKSKSKSKDSEKHKEKHKEKNRIQPGLVEISAEGTGFAGGGENIAKKRGVAFQC